MLLAIRRAALSAAAVSFILASLAVPAAAHKSSGYSHDEGAKTSNPRWMTALSGEVVLGQLSIPGTHDTMSFYGGDIAQAQTMPLDKQLQSGIRALDIRLWHVADGFEVNHGYVPQFAKFSEVLSTVVAFLVNNPGEAVLMRLTEASSPFLTSESFESTFKHFYWEKYKDYFYDGSSDNPKLKDIRGRIVVLQKFKAEERYGIPYKSFDIQDDWHLNSNADLYDKWKSVKAQLAKANNDTQPTTYMNYLSAAGGSFPYFVASGHSSPGTSAPRLATGRTSPGWKSWHDFPRVNCAIGICTIAYEGTDVLTYERLGKDFKKRVGVIMADFPGHGLIDRIIALNDSLKGS
ncbi:MAG TPA: phosphatidylinositol-specific phospholipase C [Candidatus Elarobacter sp.]|jgi:1-phosphatidylinositol phosphodiesterase